MTNNQAKFFPLTGVPPRRFNLGDRVTTTFFDAIPNETYLSESTIFGYQYQHPLWFNDSELLIRGYEGWVYMLVRTYDSGEPNLTCPFVFYVEESSLSLLEGLDAPEIVLTYEAIVTLFGDNWSLREPLECCNVAIVGNPEGTQVVVSIPGKLTRLVDCVRENLPQLQSALGEVNLSQDVKIKLV